MKEKYTASDGEKCRVGILLLIYRLTRNAPQMELLVRKENTNMYLGQVRLWCLAPLSTIFQLYRGVSFLGRVPRVTAKLYHILL